MVLRGKPQGTRLLGVPQGGSIAGALLADKLLGGRAAGLAGVGRVVGQGAELVIRRVVLVLVVLEVLHERGARACTRRHSYSTWA